jgi:hypothetical protein
VGDADHITLSQPKLFKGLLAQPQLIHSHNLLIIDHIEHSQHMLMIMNAVDLHLGQCLESLGAIDRAVTVQVGDVLLVGVDGDAPQLQGLFWPLVHEPSIAGITSL